MKKTVLSLLIGSIYISSCEKENFAPTTAVAAQAARPCEFQTANPAGRSYDKDSVVRYDCSESHCGIMPLSVTNYWVYLDSVYADGIFVRAQYDTLRFTNSWKSLSDGLVWWEGNISVGLPDRLYANDSSLFKLENRMFNSEVVDAKKEFGLFPGDSIRYLTSFEDAAAIGRLLKISTSLITPAGIFDGCIYFEKNARNYRRDQLYFKPGVGVLKYIQEKAPMGTREIKLQQISTLVRYSIG